MVYMGDVNGWVGVSSVFGWMTIDDGLSSDDEEDRQMMKVGR